MKKSKKYFSKFLFAFLFLCFLTIPHSWAKGGRELLIFWLVEKKEVEKIEKYRYLLSLLEKSPRLHLNFSFPPSVIQPWMTSAPDLIEKLKGLLKRKQISIVFPPWYEPILPLLSDYNPAVNFSYPEDIREQIVRSWEVYQQSFGALPSGIVPPSGAISPVVLNILSEFEVEWVLGAQEGGEYLPIGKYTVETGREIYLFFREKETSQLLEDLSATVSAREGIKQWIEQIERKDFPLIVATIEGEKMWNREEKILEQLFAQIIREDFLTFTAEDYILKNPAAKKIEKINPFTWVKDGFSAWTEKPEKKAAWELLRQARAAVEKYKNSGQAEVKVLDAAFEEIYACEAGENFFLFGDPLLENSEKAELVFRLRLANIYRLIGHPLPQELFHPLASYSFLGSLLSEEEETKVEVNESEKSFSLVDLPSDSQDGEFDLKRFSCQEVLTPLGAEEIVFSFDFFCLLSTVTVRGGQEPVTISTENATSYQVEPSSAAVEKLETKTSRIFVDLYIDLNNRVGAGSTTLLPGRKASTLPENAWEYALTVELSSLSTEEGLKEAKIYRAKESGLAEEVRRLSVSNLSKIQDTCTFSVSVPREILSGSPLNWGYIVTLLKQEANSEEMRVVDLLVPRGKTQKQILGVLNLSPQLSAIRVR